MFIRMYILLQVFTLTDLYLHLKRMNGQRPKTANAAIKKERSVPVNTTATTEKSAGADAGERRGFLRESLWYVLIFSFTVAGFLTHYYFVIFAFFSSAFYFLFSLSRKRVREAVCYGVTRILALLCSWFLFRSMQNQIFSGYRGKEAIDNLLGSREFLSNLKGWFYGVSNSFFAGGLFVALILAAVYLTLYYLGKWPRSEPVLTVAKAVARLQARIQETECGGIDRNICYLFTVACGYTLILCRVSPMQMDYYYTPVYSILIALSVYFLAQLARLLTKKKWVGVLLLGIWFGYTSGVVLRTGAQDLNGVNRHRVASEYFERECMYVSNSDGKINAGAVIYSFDELRYFEQVYYTTAKDLERLDDEKLRKARQLLVYIDSNGDVEQALLQIGHKTGLTQWEYQYEDYVAKVYLLTEETGK